MMQAMTVSNFKSMGTMVNGAYAIGLRSEPTSPVAVMLSSSGEIHLRFEPSTIYFTRDQWHKPVQVHFEAQNTSAAALLATSVVHSSESQDKNYDHSHANFIPSKSFEPFAALREVI